MHGKNLFKVILAIGMMVMLIALPLLGACGGGEAPAETPAPTQAPASTPTPAPTQTPATTPEVTAFDAVQTAAYDYVNDDSTWNIKAADLFGLINDDDEDNDPYIISLRKADQFAKGHIKGAVNIPFGELFSDANLAKLPTDQKIVLYCYTGQTASQATAMLGTLGYDVDNLLHGMCGWSCDSEIAPSCFDIATSSNEYATETEANVPTDTFDPPTLSVTATEADAMVIEAVQAYTKTKNIAAGDLFTLIKDDDEDNDPFIISVRKPDDYAKGHVPGAVNLPCPVLFDADNLAKLPTDQKIVVYCYTGHSASQATALLNVLGYDAFNLKFGIASWTNDDAVNSGKYFKKETGCGDYAVEQ